MIMAQKPASESWRAVDIHYNPVYKNQNKRRILFLGRRDDLASLPIFPGMTEFILSAPSHKPQKFDEIQLEVMETEDNFCTIKLKNDSKSMNLQFMKLKYTALLLGNGWISVGTSIGFNDKFGTDARIERQTFAKPCHSGHF